MGRDLVSFAAKLPGFWQDWNSDRKYRRALRPLNEFAKTHPDLAGSILDLTGGQLSDFGPWFYKGLDRRFTDPVPSDDFLELLNRLLPVAYPQSSPLSDEFWQALYGSAKAITRDRVAAGRLRALWGTTPILTLRDCAEACRRIGVEADSVVFKTYYTTS